jgi:arginine decarboxylase
VLKYVEFDSESLMSKLRRDVEAAVNASRMEDQQAGRLLRFYEEALMGYTYLEDPDA